MSILNRPSDGLVSVLVALVRASVMIGTMPKSKLLDICSPKSLGDGKQDMATKTTNRWIELGLFEVSDNDEIKVADKYRSKLRKMNASAESVSDAARDVVLLHENNGNFWNDEENRSADFTRAVSWMLAQDVHEFIPTSYSQVEPRALEQAKSENAVIFQNDTRWSGFVSWATFLGFGRSESGKASGGFISDPTQVLVSVLESVLPKKKEIGVNDLLSDIADMIPVFDRGTYRQEVEKNLRPEKWKAPGPNQLSTSMSRALLRLEAQGMLRLEKRSDADFQVRLLGRGNKAVRNVTHVQRGDLK